MGAKGGRGLGWGERGGASYPKKGGGGGGSARGLGGCGARVGRVVMTRAGGGGVVGGGGAGSRGGGQDSRSHRLCPARPLFYKQGGSKLFRPTLSCQSAFVASDVFGE